ncbi:hypothetical protein M405DRAFT_189726 [Rhizopogon salebrosus TDB-379]|nr:hypothetical protein M405DRAFT_189726 [Rhizopogon salebrosus TDB-379]
MQIRKPRQQFVSPSDAEVAIRRVIHAHMENFPPRLFDTTTGLLHDRDAQINAFKTSTQYKEILSLTIKHADRRSERIEEVILVYFRYAMLSHRWEGKEPLLHDIQDKVVYELEPVDGVHKLQSFCKVARDAGYRWAWSDTCCIDKSNNVELQESVNTMFVWYRFVQSTIINAQIIRLPIGYDLHHTTWHHLLKMFKRSSSAFEFSLWESKCRQDHPSKRLQCHRKARHLRW